MKDDTSPFTTDYPVSTPPNLSSRLDSKGYTPSYDDIVQEVKEKQLSSRLDSKGYTPDYAFRGNPHMGK